MINLLTNKITRSKKINKLYKNRFIIYNANFKCSQCGETDQDLAEKYCGNVGCKYKT